MYTVPLWLKIFKFLEWRYKLAYNYTPIYTGYFLERNMSLKIAVMPGDGIGIEIVDEAVKILITIKTVVGLMSC